MTESHSTSAPAPSKPKKPRKPVCSTVHPNQPFPLTVNPCGYWSKKIKRRVHYFGKWSIGPEAAERMYLDRKADLEAGRTPEADRPHADGLTVKALLNEYRAHKKRMMDRGELAERTYRDVAGTCDFLAAKVDKNRLVTDLRPDDFAKLLDVLLKQRRQGKEKSLVVLGNRIVRIKSVFRYADKEGLIDKPVRFGSDFAKPAAKNIERQKREKIEGIRDEGAEPTFTRDELLKMLGAATQPLKAMILLAVNAALGNSDIGQMRMSHVNLATGWLDYARPKTEVARRAKLWPETVDAIKDWLTKRPDPKDPKHAKLVFITKYKNAWDKALSAEMSKLLDELGIKRSFQNTNANRGFYCLRATFRTEAARSLDAEAVYCVMGHTLPGMGSHYVKFVHDDRLAKVAQVVHDWLWPKADGATTDGVNVE